MYALLAPTVAVMCYGFYRLGRNWRGGASGAARFDQPWVRFNGCFATLFCSSERRGKLTPDFFTAF
jgi:hypothetical protein